jgi:mannose-6-phosphate isomerase-like protein (cupin superfamily)
MKTHPCLSLLALAAVLLLPAQAADRPPLGPPPKDVVYFGHDQVDADFAKGTSLLLNTVYKAYAARRDHPGAVEIHELDTDLFYIVEGDVTFVTGGTAVDIKRIGPNELHATSITGGTPHHLTKGDVIIIPKGVPHQFTAVASPLRYLLIKVKE